MQRAIASRVECEHRVRFSFTSSVARILDYIASLDSAATTAAVSLTLFHLQRQRRPCTPSSPDDFLLFLPLQPPPIASPLFSPPTAVCFLFSFDALRLSATKSCTMDALTDLDAVPIFHQVLYEKEALKLKEGQSEDALDLALRNAALAAGVETRDLELPVRSTSLAERLCACADPVLLLGLVPRHCAHHQLASPPLIRFGQHADFMFDRHHYPRVPRLHGRS